MWIRIRAVIIEDEPLAAEYLAALLDESCQVEVVGSATESETGLRLCEKALWWKLAISDGPVSVVPSNATNRA
jgi:DNA-binding NarL/FixJ family response regulator